MILIKQFILILLFITFFTAQSHGQMTLETSLNKSNITYKGEKDTSSKKRKLTHSDKLIEIDTFLAHEVSDLILEKAHYIHFEANDAQFLSTTLSQSAFDSIIKFFEKYDKLKLIIRIKNESGEAKNRVIFLYNYIFKNHKIKAQQIDIQRFKPKDHDYIWRFENKEMAIAFDIL